MSIVDRLFGRRDRAPRPETRLSEAQASRIAHDAAAAVRPAPQLALRGVWIEAERLAWHFWTPTRGSGLEVTVDDATGAAQVTQRSGR